MIYNVENNIKFEYDEVDDGKVFYIIESWIKVKLSIVSRILVNCKDFCFIFI